MYCTLQDLIDRFSQEEILELSDRNSMDEINEQIVNQAISDASVLIDGYIGSRVALPLASVPAVLVPIACDIARYKLYDDAPSETVKNRYDSAEKFLLSVNQGKVSLGISVSGDSPQSNDLATVESAGSVFSRQNARDFI